MAASVSFEDAIILFNRVAVVFAMQNPSLVYNNAISALSACVTHVDTASISTSASLLATSHHHLREK